MSNFIKVDRKILKWEWWSDINTFRLFMYMLLAAWWKDGKYKGNDIFRGSFPSSIAELSKETNLTENEIRTALKHLKSTGEITSKSHSKYTVFTVKNYDIYQSNHKQDYSEITGEITSTSQPDNEQLTSKSQAVNKQITNLPIIKENKNIRSKEDKEDKKERKEEDISTISKEIVCQTDVRRITEKWNTLSEFGVKPVKRIKSGTQVYERLCARIREYGIEEVLSTIDMVKQSDFLLGKVKDFRITLDWFSRPNNFQKIYNGNYDNGQKRTSGYQSQTAQMLDSFYDQTSEWVRKMEEEERMKHDV